MVPAEGPHQRNATIYGYFDLVVRCQGSTGFPCRVVALTSAIWLTDLVVLDVSLTSKLQMQDQRLQQPIEQIELN